MAGGLPSADGPAAGAVSQSLQITLWCIKLRFGVLSDKEKAGEIPVR